MSGTVRRIAILGSTGSIGTQTLEIVERFAEEFEVVGLAAGRNVEQSRYWLWLEAMAAGVPVITSDRCGMPYMVSHGETGFLVDPANPQDIVRRMQQLLGNDELRHDMSDRARQIARDRFHPAVVARRTYQVYQEAIYDYRYRTTFTGIAS